MEKEHILKDIDEILKPYMSEEDIKSNWDLIYALASIKNKFIYEFPKLAHQQFGSLHKHGVSKKMAPLNATIDLTCAFKMGEVIIDNHCKNILNIDLLNNS